MTDIKTEGHQVPDESQSIQEYYYGYYCSCEDPEPERDDMNIWYDINCGKPMNAEEPDYDEDLLPF